MRLILIMAAASASIAVDLRTAEACSPPYCTPSYFTPANGATVPANIPGLYWRPTREAYDVLRDPQQVILAEAATPTVPLAFTTRMLTGGNYLIVPDQPLVAGTSYIVTDNNVCASSSPTSVTFQVGPAAALPGELGTLTAIAGDVGPLTVATISGSCTSEVDADRATIVLELGAAASPWRDALHIETLVDGTPWGAVRLPGSTQHLVYRICRTDDPGVAPGLDAGVHQVTMNAMLPGSDLAVTTAAVSVELECAAPVEPDMTTDTAGSGGGCGGCSNATPASPWLFALAVGLRLRRRRRG